MCDSATATVVVTPTPVIDAVNDSYPGIPAASGTTTAAVTVNDTVNFGTGTASVTLGTNASIPVATLTSAAPLAGSITFNTLTGVITVAAGTSPGTYTYNYQLCVLPAQTPAVCDSATATVVVGPGAVVPTVTAANDTLGTLPASGGTTTPVTGNDSVNITGTSTAAVLTGGGANVSIPVATLTGSPSSPGTSVTFNTLTGQITVLSGSVPGTYTFTYQLCLFAPNAGVCSTATAVVTVSPVVPPALTDVSVAITLPTTAAPGTTVTGVVTYTNNTAVPTTFTSAITVNGQISTTVQTLLPNGNVVLPISVFVGPSGASVSASASGSTVPEITLANNNAAASITPNLTDVSTTIALPTSAVAGTTVTGIVTYTNLTNVATTFVSTVVVNGIVVTTTQTLPPNGSVAVPVSVFVGTASANITASASASAVPEVTLANNNAAWTIAPLFTDVSTTLAMPTSAVAGTTVTGTVTYTNTTNIATTFTSVVTVNGVPVTSIQTLQAGGSVSLPVSVFVGTNTVSVSANASGSTVPEITLSNNSAVASVTPLFTDIGTTITLPPSAVVGTTVTGTVTYTNNSNVPAAFTSTVTINGATSITVQTLPANGVITVPVTVRIVSTGATVTAVASDSTVPESNLSNNAATVFIEPILPNARISGRVWLDTDSNRTYTTGTDLDLSGWRVELLLGSEVVGTATTSADGRYSIGNQIPASGYSVRFKNPSGQIVVSTPFNQGPLAQNGRVTQNGNPSLGTTASIYSGSSIVGGAIDTIALYQGDNTIDQNLPIDPSGIVYDAITRLPVAGAIVTLVGPDGNPVPVGNLLQGSSTQTTDASGIYQFDILPTAPSGRYSLQITPPRGYVSTPAVQGGVAPAGVAPGTLVSSGTIANGVFTPPSGAFVLIQPNASPPNVGTNGAGAIGTAGTQYFLAFEITTNGLVQSAGVIHNHIPLDPIAAGALLVTKVGDKSVAEVADSVRYTIRIRNTTATTIANVKLEDLLPAGFRYILGTSRLNGSATLADPAGGVGRALTFNIGTVAANTTVELNYFVRLGVGSQQGDGVNRATAVFLGANGAPVRSNTAIFKVKVQGGVFSNDGCIIGKVYVDCDGSSTQGNESGSRELGIPGVRLVMLDGTYVITDNEGKYSLCGVKPQTHVIKVDRSTLPKGSRLLPSSNRNAGVGDSIFVDMKGGELARADFIEGSCSPEVLDQVKARRAQGGVLAPEKEQGSDLKIDNRPLDIQQQILPGVRPTAPALLLVPGAANPNATQPGGAIQ